MDEKFVAQLIAELQDAQIEALALLTKALCQQLDPKRLRADLDHITKAYLQMARHNPTAVRMVQGAMAAAHAEQMLQGTPPDEARRPTPEG